MKYSKFKVVLSPGEPMLAYIDGQIVEGVQGLSMEISDMGLSRVSLDFYSDDISVEANPTLMRSVFGMTIMDVIEGLSPKEIESGALNNLSMGDNVVEAIINEIKRRVEDATQS